MNLIKLISLAGSDQPNYDSSFALIDVHPAPDNIEAPETTVEIFSCLNGTAAIATLFKNEREIYPYEIEEYVLDHANRKGIDRVYLRIDPSMTKFC